MLPAKSKPVIHDSKVVKFNKGQTEELFAKRVYWHKSFGELRFYFSERLTPGQYTIVISGDELNLLQASIENFASDPEAKPHK